MEISFYEVPSRGSTFSVDTKEKFLKTVNAMVIPQIGELVGFEDSLVSYRVVDVSTWYGQDDCSIDILLVNSEKV